MDYAWQSLFIFYTSILHPCDTICYDIQLLDSFAYSITKGDKKFKTKSLIGTFICFFLLRILLLWR